MSVRALIIGVLFMTLASVSVAQYKEDEGTLEFAIGLQSYADEDYGAAIQHFKNAVALAPDLPHAHVYLGLASVQRTSPRLQTEDNKRIAQAEIDKGLQLITDNSLRAQALKVIASVYLNLYELDRAREYERKLVAADPNDAEAHYFLGAIDWMLTSKPRQQLRKKLGLSANAPLPGAACSKLRADNQEKVTEGIQMLEKALALRPDYDNAMAYMNLMYRERADIQCGNPAARSADLKKADDWVDITLATKKRKAVQQQIPPTAPPK